MEHRKFGNTGMEVSVLGFGGAEIGYEGADDATVERLLGAALDAGLNVVDTAECYVDSEEKIGRAIGHRREEFFLFTKCGHRGESGIDLPDWHPKLLEQTIDRSLRNLQTDRVDLIQLHSCSEDILRQGDVIDVLRRAKETGKTRFIGYSGDRNDAAYAIESGAFDTLQTSVNIADQECLTLTLPKAKARGMGVIAKRPIANAAWKTGALKPDNGYNHTYWERLRKLAYPFLETSLADAVATALRFTLAQDVHTAIVGTKSPERWGQNARTIAAGPLGPEEVTAVRARWQEVAPPDWVGQG